MGVLELLGSHILIWALKEQTMWILPHPKQIRAHLPIILYLFIKLCLLYLQLWQFDKTDMRVQDICTFVKSPRGLEFGPCVIWGVGSWDPLVRQKWRQIWKRCLCWRRLHNIDPALQYLHMTAQYAEWGGYNICTCPYLCTYNHMLDSRGGEEGFGGRQEFRRTDLGRWVLPSGVLAGPQGYRPCTRI